MALGAEDQGCVAGVLDLPLWHGNKESSSRNTENNDEHYSQRSSVHEKSIEPAAVRLDSTLVGPVVNPRLGVHCSVSNSLVCRGGNEASPAASAARNRICRKLFGRTKRVEEIQFVPGFFAENTRDSRFRFVGYGSYC